MKEKGARPPVFGSCLLWPNGRPSQLLLSSCYNLVTSLGKNHKEVKITALGTVC